MVDRIIVRLFALLILLGLNLTNVERGVAQEQSAAATRQYAVAVGFQNQKLYEQAIDEWQTFLKKFPTDNRKDKARHYLATCALQAGKLDQAVTEFEQVVKLHPKFSLLDATLLNLGIAHYNRAQKSEKPADYKKADQSFGLLLQKFPKSNQVSQALFYRGESLYHQDKHADAAAAYSALIKDHPKSPLLADAYYALGVTQESLKKPTQAAVAFNTFMAKYSKHPLANEVRMRQAEILFKNEDYEKAQSLFAVVGAVKGFRHAPVALLRQARCLYEQDKFTEAGKLYWDVPRRFPGTEHYDTAILAGAKCYYLIAKYDVARSGLQLVADRNKPEAAEAIHWIARAWLKQNNAAKALQVLDAGIAKHSDSDKLPQLQLTRADAIYEIPARKSEAVALYASFAQKYPADELAPQAQYMAALAALGLGQHAVAESHSDKFLAKYAQNKLKPDVLFISAESRLLQGAHAAAEQRYRQFLTESPQHSSAEQARVRLGLALQLQKKYDNAVAWLEPLAGKLKDAALKSEALYLIGRSYAEQDKPTQAVKALEDSLKAKPDREQSDETMLALAETYQKLNRKADAAKQVTQMLRAFPNSEHLDEANYRMGEYAYADGKLDAAIEHYAVVVSKWPKSTFAPHAQYGIGWAMFGQQDFAGTVKAMGQLITSYPTSEVKPRANYVRAMAYQQLEEFAAAVGEIETFLASKPKQIDQLDAQYVMGLCQAGLQKFEQASLTFQSILKTDPKYAGADKVTYELGWAFAELGKEKESVAVFKKLAIDYPKSPLAAESLFRVAESLYEAKNYTDAAVAYYDAQEKAGATELGEKALHKLGWTYLKQDSFDKAAQTFAIQLKTLPDGELAEDATFLIGECEFKKKQWKVALERFGKIVAAKSPRYHALALYRSGQCTGSLEQWPASLKFYTQVLDEFPEFEQRPEARYGLGWALHQQDQLDEAVKQYEKVTDETDTETAAQARFMIGECYFAQKQHKEAIKHFLKTVFAYQHKDWSPMAYFEAGRCFEVLKDKPQAITTYRKIIEMYPKHAKAAGARQRIAALGG